MGQACSHARRAVAEGLPFLGFSFSSSMKHLDEIKADGRHNFPCLAHFMLGTWKALFRDLGRSSGDPCWDGSLQKWLPMYTVQVSKDLAHSDIKNFRVKVLHFCYTHWPSI